MDRSVGLYAFGVIASALFARERTGQGQRVDVPMFETMVPYVLGDHLYGHKYSPPQGDFGYPRILSPLRKPFPHQGCVRLLRDLPGPPLEGVPGNPGHERYVR